MESSLRQLVRLAYCTNATIQNHGIKRGLHCHRALHTQNRPIHRRRGHHSISIHDTAVI